MVSVTRGFRIPRGLSNMFSKQSRVEQDTNGARSVSKEVEDIKRAEEAEGLLPGESMTFTSTNHSKNLIVVWCFRLVQLLIIILAVIGVLSLFRGDWWHRELVSVDSHDPKDPCYCGKTLAEAKARGCRYDSIAIQWLPPACRDDELNDEFERAGPHGAWEYFSDEAKTRKYSVEEVAEMADRNGFFWATHRWHLLHCTYTWRKLFRQRFTGTVIEGHSDTMGHIDHCEHIIQMSFEFDELMSQARVWLDPDALHLENQTSPDTTVWCNKLGILCD